MGKGVSALMHADQIDEFVDGLNGSVNHVIVTFVTSLDQRLLQITSPFVYLGQGNANKLRVFIVLSGEENGYQVDFLDEVDLFYVLDQ